MQGYDVNRASKRKPLRIWVILSPAVVSGAQFGRQRQKLSKELYSAGWRLSRLFRGWEAGTPTGLLVRGVEGRLSASPLHCILKTHQ